MTKDGWKDCLDVTIESERCAGHVLIERVLALLTANHWTGNDYFSVHMALEEAVVNAIKHGNGCDVKKNVHVECRVSPSKVWIRVTDEGSGFDPMAIADCTDREHVELPCGRGIMLMRHFMNYVEYNDRGNRVTLEKWRAAAE